MFDLKMKSITLGGTCLFIMSVTFISQPLKGGPKDNDKAKPSLSLHKAAASHDQATPLSFNDFVVKESALSKRLEALGLEYGNFLEKIKNVVEAPTLMQTRQTEFLTNAVKDYHQKVDAYRDELHRTIEQRFKDNSQLRDYWIDVVDAEADAMRFHKATLTKSGFLFANDPVKRKPSHEKWTMTMEPTGEVKFTKIDGNAPGPDKNILIEGAEKDAFKVLRQSVNAAVPKGVNGATALGYVKGHLQTFNDHVRRHSAMVKAGGAAVLMEFAVDAIAKESMVAPTEKSETEAASSENHGSGQ